MRTFLYMTFGDYPPDIVKQKRHNVIGRSICCQSMDLWRFIDEIPYWMAEKHGKKYRLMYQVYTHPKYKKASGLVTE